jgi:gluconate 2-dehydrogenase alpha chain
VGVKNKRVDAVIVGFGWTGAIMAAELTAAGLNVVAIERGPNRDTPTDANYPRVLDELAYSVRGKLYQELAKETVTVRHQATDTAVPYRQHGSFLLGNGVGGAGFHWNGVTSRPGHVELELRTHYEQRYGKNFITPDMTIQDFGVTYNELEPHFTRFEEVAGVSGKAGNINGQIEAGGNPFEAWRSKDYPLPPLKSVYGESLFSKAAVDAGFHPFPLPAANASQAYTNPYGVRLGPCNFCGFCENFGCYMYSKGSPQTSILPMLLTRKNFALLTQSHVLRVNLDTSGKFATGVTYINASGEEVEQPADLVVLSAFQLHNVRLLLLSGIGKPYDYRTAEGVIGRNFAYQMISSVTVKLKKGYYLNPFIGTGAGGHGIDDFNGDNFDHGPLGFVGGANINHHRSGGRPIRQASTSKGAPRWGSEWKADIQDNYQRVMSIGSMGSSMSYRDNFLDLDPTYKDAYGQPLLRITHDWHENDLKMTRYVTERSVDIAHLMDAESYHANARTGHWDTKPYQSTHLTGGAIMGHDPRTSALNRYLQSWDVSNVFVLGASAFPQNWGGHPTGLVGGLAYWAAHAIRTQYLAHPGPLVQS